MRGIRNAGLVALVALGLSLAGCGNSKLQQQNEQLQSQVLQLQKDNGDLGNQLQVANAAQQTLTAQNEKLREENQARTTRRPKEKSRKRRRK
jgi:uncharacterized protein HemX